MIASGTPQARAKFGIYAGEKPDGGFRVLSLGDSHTVGFEVRQEHTFSEVLERFLRRARTPEPRRRKPCEHPERRVAQGSEAE